MPVSRGFVAQLFTDQLEGQARSRGKFSGGTPAFATTTPAVRSNKYGGVLPTHQFPTPEGQYVFTIRRICSTAQATNPSTHLRGQFHSMQFHSC